MERHYYGCISTPYAVIDAASGIYDPLPQYASVVIFDTADDRNAWINEDQDNRFALTSKDARRLMAATLNDLDVRDAAHFVGGVELPTAAECTTMGALIDAYTAAAAYCADVDAADVSEDREARNLTISITIEYKRNRTWGWNPTATVTASLAGVRTDTTKGMASGCGYDKLSAAVCYAFRENPLLQTLLLWGGWNTDTESYGPGAVRDREWSFAGMGMSALLRHLRANGCHVTETLDTRCDPVAYTVTRDMPASFVALV